MTIDISSERVVTFPEAAKSLPNTPHLSTLHRWRLKGVRGVKLDTCLIGGKRYTSLEALERFVVATTRAADNKAGYMKAMPVDARLRPDNRSKEYRQRSAEEILDKARI